MIEPAKKTSVWTEAVVKQLNSLKASGFSASKIAACLGPNFTRNMVIGKLYRQKIQRHILRD